jgi:type I restriction enzyme S subunit
LKVGRYVDEDSILVTCIAGSPATIGNVVLTNRKVAFNQQINSLTPTKQFDPLFIYCLFKFSKKQIQSSTTKGMKRIITKSVFENLEMINPPLRLQQKFASIVGDTESLRQSKSKAK